MRYLLIALLLLFSSVPSARAQMGIGIGLPGLSIGINLPLFPELVQVPGHPVYYAPRLDANFFFYDGLYWVYQGDDWYASSWYSGPWDRMDPTGVPLFVLRIPVRYYRHPPAYFRGWRSDAPPRWGEHWGHEWERRRSGWDRWDRHSVPSPAPLPAYQRNYSGDRYPRAEQQRALHSRNYRYQPREAVVRQHYQGQAVRRAPAPAEREQQGAPQERNSRQRDSQRSEAPPPLKQGGAVQRERQAPRPDRESVPQSRGASQEPVREQGQKMNREKGDERGQERGQDRGQDRNR